VITFFTSPAADAAAYIYTSIKLGFARGHRRRDVILVVTLGVFALAHCC